MAKGKKKGKGKVVVAKPKKTISGGVQSVTIRVIKELGNHGAGTNWGKATWNINDTNFPKLARIKDDWAKARITRIEGKYVNGLIGIQGHSYLLLENFQRNLNTEADMQGAKALLTPLTRGQVGIQSPPASTDNRITGATNNYSWQLHVGTHLPNAPTAAVAMGTVEMNITFACQGPI
jgi:hypothetical protein